MKNLIKNGGLVLLGLLSSLGVANAALPLVVSDATTGAFAVLTDDINSMFDLIWPLVVVVTVGFILIRMFKKGAGAAT